MKALLTLPTSSILALALLGCMDEGPHVCERAIECFPYDTIYVDLTSMRECRKVLKNTKQCWEAFEKVPCSGEEGSGVFWQRFTEAVHTCSKP